MLYQLLGTIILTAFYACYFIKMFVQKKKGISTNQLGKGKSGFVRFIEITVKLSSILVPVVEIVSIVLDTFSLPNGLRLLGAGLGMVGVAVFITSVVTMRDSWRAGVPEADKTELVTDGIYQISRNPAFLGFDLVYAGILLMFFNWPLLAVSAFGVIMFHLQIVHVEEDFLLMAFGDEYIAYKRSVRRYLGRRRPPLRS